LQSGRLISSFDTVFSPHKVKNGYSHLDTAIKNLAAYSKQSIMHISLQHGDVVTSPTVGKNFQNLGKVYSNIHM